MLDVLGPAMTARLAVPSPNPCLVILFHGRPPVHKLARPPSFELAIDLSQARAQSANSKAQGFLRK